MRPRSFWCKAGSSWRVSKIICGERVTFRESPDDPGARRPAGSFRLEFPRPVRGPIALGHNSHFGLGLFAPADDTATRR
jgi:CRISPR-associated protein Csb2